MISRIRGTVLTKDLDRLEVETPGGVVYEAEIPLTVFERLPAVGEAVELRTFHMVREDSATLFGFLAAEERILFGRLLNASGVGGKLALAMLSTYSASRLARVLAERDVTALTQVSGIGKKTAERLVLELADKVEDLAVGTMPDAPGGGIAQEAVSALVALGFGFSEADEAVRRVIASGKGATADELIREALKGRT